LKEFTVVAVMMMVIVTGTLAFLAIFTKWGWRVVRIIGLEHP
jgi:hypothetical protein